MDNRFLIGHSNSMRCLKIHPWSLMLATKSSPPGQDAPHHLVAREQTQDWNFQTSAIVAVSFVFPVWCFQVIFCPTITVASCPEPVGGCILYLFARTAKTNWKCSQMRNENSKWGWKKQERFDLHENIREEKRHPNLFRYFRVIKKGHNNGFLLN